MPIKWNETLAVGVAEIDRQHQEIFGRMGQLLDACSKGQGKDAVRPMIDFLEAYVGEHFRDEEKLQKNSGYPNYAQHKALHTEYLQNIANLRQQLAEHGPTLPFVITVNKTVVDWLTSHISKVDKELGTFLQSRR